MEAFYMTSHSLYTSETETKLQDLNFHIESLGEAPFCSVHSFHPEECFSLLPPLPPQSFLHITHRAHPRVFSDYIYLYICLVVL